MHQPVFLQRVHLARLGLARLEEAQRLGDGHLVDEDLARLQRRLGDAMAGLDDRCRGGRRRHRDIRHLGKEGADRDGVRRVVGALIDDLQHIVGTDDRRRHLDPAGTPAVRHRHLAAGERHLVAGNGDRLEDRAPDHALGLFVEIGEIVGGKAVVSRNVRIHHAFSPERRPKWAIMFCQQSSCW